MPTKRRAKLERPTKVSKVRELLQKALDSNQTITAQEINQIAKMAGTHPTVVYKERQILSENHRGQLTKDKPATNKQPSIAETCLYDDLKILRKLGYERVKRALAIWELFR